MTDDATDGRPWPIDPVGSEPDPEAVPVPDLSGLDDLAKVLAEFAASTNRSASTALHIAPPVGEPAGPAAAEGVTQVTDDDRNRFGMLLDHAAERGLLSVPEYELRLGELAVATSLDRMREIVTDLPVFTPLGASTAPRSPRSGSGAAVATLGSRRLTNPWIVLGLLVLVTVALLVLFVIHAEHLVHSHGTGTVSAPGGVPLLSALRL
ncbi:MAG: DUF1707 domain-containing protein [Acidimicrobiales bacterium]